MKISVIICTHNPRPDYLRLTLEALKDQTFPRDQWELLLIDNASVEPLADQWDLSWHLNGVHVREDKLGLTHARMKGIQEASTELLIFVDDDNVLDFNYLEQAAKISSNYPNIGVFGGSIKGVFEVQPPLSLQAHIGRLAVGEINNDAWGNIKGFNATCPPGAGMVIRRDIALKYQAMSQTDPKRLSLGRIGEILSSGEDVDIAWYACEIGYGMGRFKDLKMRHLIGKNRLTVDYFERLIEGGDYSNVLLFSIHDISFFHEAKTIWQKIRSIIKYFKCTPEERRFTKATARGIRTGRDKMISI